MDILQKKQITKYLVVAIVSLFLGIFLDHFLIYPFFKLDKKKDEVVIDGGEGNNIPIEYVNKVEEEEKILEVPKTCKIHVDVGGALKKPGVFCLDEGSMIIDAITKAGGFSSDVAYRFVARKMNLSQLLVDNQKLYIPYEEEMECKLVSFLPQSKEVEQIINNSTDQDMFTSDEDDSDDTSDGDSDESCVNINTASLEQLETLSGVGPAMAQKIVAGRPYSKIEDLLNVSGVGDSTFSKFKDKICI